MTNQVLLTRFRLDNSQAITQARAFEKAIRDQNTQMVQTGHAARSMSATAKANAANMNNMRRALGQASFQVADFAIVLQQGQGALRAFAIQGGQLAGSFGAVGAVIGGVITVGGLLLSTFLENADGAKELEDALKGLREEVDKLRFGPSEQEVNLNKQAEALTRELEELNRVIISTRSEFAGSKRDLEDIEVILQEMVGDEIARREEIQQQLKDIKERRAFLEREKEALNDIIGSTEGLTAANEALNELHATQLANQQAILGLLQQQVQAVVDRAAAEAALPGGYQQMLDSAAYGAGQQALRDRIQSGYTLPTPSAGGGGGASSIQSAADAAEDLNKQIKEILDKLREADKASKDWGATMVDVYEYGIGGALDGMTDALSGAEFEFKEFAKTMIREMAKMIFQASILKILMSSFGGIAGAPSNAFQEAIQSMNNIPQLAKGGVIGAPTMFASKGGGLGIMGEAGPEAVMPLSRDSSGNLGVSAVAPQITIVNNTGAEVQTRQVSDEETQIIIGRAVQATTQEISRQLTLGNGNVARSMEQGYTSRRRVT